MVSRIRRKPTVQQSMAAFEHMTKVAADAAEDERRQRQMKSERLRLLRLAANSNQSKE